MPLKNDFYVTDGARGGAHDSKPSDQKVKKIFAVCGIVFSLNIRKH